MISKGLSIKKTNLKQLTLTLNESSSNPIPLVPLLNPATQNHTKRETSLASAATLLSGDGGKT